MILLQAQATSIDIGLTYQFLHDDEADYVGIANRFADWRFDQEPSIPSPNAVPLHVDVLALESKPGLFAREKVVMTTMDDLVEIVKDLSAKVTEALFMNYVGWQQGGYSYTAPQYQRVDSILNDLGLWTTYQQSLEETNTTLHFAADPYRAYIHGRGYQTSDIIQSIGLEFLAHRDYYQLDAAAGQRIVNDLRALLNEWSIQGLSLETIGHRASSDFASQGLSKEAMIRAVADTIQETDAIDRPMSYAWHAKYLLDLPMYSSEQARFTDTVPLIPYMIAQDRIGFGRAGNFFSNTTNELLRMVDYGLYPAFYVTESSAYELIDTGSEHIFTSRYKDWQPEIKRQYDFIADALVHVLGQRIVARDVMALGVVAITYENLVRVVVNYTGEVYQQNGLNVQPMSYEVIVESLT